MLLTVSGVNGVSSQPSFSQGELGMSSETLSSLIATIKNGPCSFPAYSPLTFYKQKQQHSKTN